MDDNSSNTYYLEKAPIWRAMIHLCIPMILAISAKTVYSLISAYFIGTQHNTTMFVAISLGLPIMALGMALGGVFGVGGSTYISRLLGEKKNDDIKHVAAFTLYGSFVVGIIVAALAIININPIVHLLGANAASFEFTRNFVLVTFIALPIMMANFAIEQIVRSTGAAKQSMYGVVLSIIANCLFDILFIMVLHWNVIGAALAIGIAGLVSLLYYVFYLQKNSGYVKLSPRHFKITKKISTQVFSIGMSELVMSSFMIVTALLFNNFAIQYGDSLLASGGIAARIVQVPEFVVMGIALGITPLLGFTYGAKSLVRLRSVMAYSAVVIGVLTAIFSVAVYVFRDTILGWFSNDPSVLAIGGVVLLAQLVSTIFNGFTGLFMSYFQATNKPVRTTIMSFVQGGLFIPVVIVAHVHFGLYGIIWSITVTEVITLVLSIVLLFGGRLNAKKSAAVNA
jgi:multidrug efflux pump